MQYKTEGILHCKLEVCCGIFSFLDKGNGWPLRAVVWALRAPNPKRVAKLCLGPRGPRIRGQKNINNCSGLSRERVGVKFVYVLPVSCGKKGKHINKDFPGQSQDNPGTIQEQKISPKVFRTDIWGHSRGCPGPNLRSGWSKSWRQKTSISARTSTTLRDFQKASVRKTLS